MRPTHAFGLARCWGSLRSQNGQLVEVSTGCFGGHKFRYSFLDGLTIVVVRIDSEIVNLEYSSPKRYAMNTRALTPLWAIRSMKQKW